VTGLSIKHILVPTDFSSTSQAALEMAAELARRFDASLTLFHVHQVPSYLYPDGMMPVPSRLMQDLEASVVAELTRLAERLQRDGYRVDFRHTIGAPAGEICFAAEELGVDLIVMGTHGRSGLSHMLLGSVAEKVVQKAHCPVLTVHAHEGRAEHAGA
jgi:nucleotide-binding universal stress UspA family protein